MDYKIFYDEGKISQIRFFLEDDDEQVKNKMLILSKKHFKDKVSLQYEKHFFRDGKKVIESYYNDELHSIFEITSLKNRIITKGYSKDKILFSSEVIHTNSEGRPITEEQYIKLADGSVLEYKSSLR